MFDTHVNDWSAIQDLQGANIAVARRLIYLLWCSIHDKSCIELDRVSKDVNRIIQYLAHFLVVEDLMVVQNQRCYLRL